MWFFELAANLVQIIIGAKLTFDAVNATKEKWRSKYDERENKISDKTSAAMDSDPMDGSSRDNSDV